MDSRDHAYVKESPVSGRGLFAKKSLGAGELVFSIDRPFVAALDISRLSDTCSECFACANEPEGEASLMGIHQNWKGKGKPRACTACNVLSFCDKDCQSKSWTRYHKLECKTFRKMPLERRGQLPHVARAAIQILTRRVKGLMSDEEWAAFERLESHTDDVRRNNRGTFGALTEGIWRYSGVEGTLGLDVAQSVFGKILTNSLTLITPTFEPLGLCVDPFAALANHSCDPNAFVVMDGPTLAFRTLRPIGADEEIAISYIESTNPYYRRQHELKTRWFFDCACAKCQKGPTLREDAIKPPNSKPSRKWIETIEHLEHQTRCGQAPENKIGDDDESKRLQTMQGLAFQDLAEAKLLPPVEAVEILERGMKTCSNYGMFDVARQPYAALRHDLMVNLLSTGQYGAAFVQGWKLYFDINPLLYPQPHHPLRVLHGWTLALLTIYLAHECVEGNDRAVKDLVEKFELELGVIAYNLLLETSSNVVLSHGKDSSFAREVSRKFAEVKGDMVKVDAASLQRAEVQREEQWTRLRALEKTLEV